MSKRILTEYEVRVFRLCHHDFDGLSTAEASSVLDISERRVQQILDRIKKKCPQLFPILTARQKRIYDLWCEYKTDREIAKELDISIKTVRNIIQHCKEKLGLYFPPHSKMLQYVESMDDEVKRKF